MGRARGQSKSDSNESHVFHTNDYRPETRSLLSFFLERKIPKTSLALGLMRRGTGISVRARDCGFRPRFSLFLFGNSNKLRRYYRARRQVGDSMMSSASLITTGGTFTADPRVIGVSLLIGMGH